MAADVLSDLLRTVRLTGATFFDVAAREPWVAEQPTADMVLPKILPGAEHLISYHVVSAGKCFASILDGAKNGDPVSLEAGEVIVFTHGSPHVMASAPGMRAAPVKREDYDAKTAGQRPFRLNVGTDGPLTQLVCGFLACDARPFNPLLEHLPPIIKAKDPDKDGNGWLGQLVRLGVTESQEKRAGGDSVLAKLSELMFIEVLRQHVEAMPPEEAGWLAGVRDPFVGKALSFMHEDPARDWTIESLAGEVGLSRSVLAERFTDLLGIPPMQYLAKWRMQIASGLLSSGNATMAQIAAAIGYESEAAFSRAFKKMAGLPPSAWRERALNAAG